MNPQNEAKLTAFGVDLPRTIARFGGNENLMMSFMRELGEDETMPQIRAAYDAGDRAAFFASVHAMKGLAGSLGLNELFNVSVQIMDALRASQDDDAKALYPALLNEYERAVAMTKELL